MYRRLPPDFEDHDYSDEDDEEEESLRRVVR
jgi:hypothetical protein